jgi:serine/threonine protein kinase
MDLAPGSTFAGYRVEALVGRGGMGVVYRARQLSLDRAVALKLIAPALASDALFRARFQREARLAAQIEHPHVLPIYEAGEHDGALFLAMRYIDGLDLEAMIAADGPLEPALAAGLIGQLASALDAAHARGLVHRDVKPANVLVESRDGEAHAYLTDFGLTKQVGSTSGLTSTSIWVGTVDYAAPEQLQSGPTDARSDVYSLGCLLYELLTGQVPFPRPRELSKIVAHASEPPPDVSAALPGVREAFDAIVRRAMAKAPDDRYQRAGDLGRAALDAAGVTGPVRLGGRFSARAAEGRAVVDPAAPTAG